MSIFKKLFDKFRASLPVLDFNKFLLYNVNQTFDTGSYSAINNPPTTLSGSFQLASNRTPFSNQIVQVITTADGSEYTRSYDGGSSSWSGWVAISGGGSGGLTSLPISNFDGTGTVNATAIRLSGATISQDGATGRALLTTAGGTAGVTSVNTETGAITLLGQGTTSIINDLPNNSIIIRSTGATAGVSSVNTETGDITLVGTGTTTVSNDLPNNRIVINSTGATAGVTSLNNLTSDVTAVAGNNMQIAVDTTARTLTFTATGGGGGGNQASFDWNPKSGQVPFTSQFTDTTQPPPTGWTWTVGGAGVVSADYTIVSPTLAQTLITFNRATTFTVTLATTKTGIVYNSFTVVVTPQPATVIQGDFTVALAFGSPAGALSKPYWSYSATDVFAVTSNKINAQTCQLVNNSQIVVTGSPQPTLTVTADNINTGAIVNTGTLGLPNFPAVYYANIDALMNNSDATTTDKDNRSNNVNYYVPALWIQNGTLTAPTFTTTLPSRTVQPTNYVAGQSFPSNADSSLGIKVLWVAFPILPSPFPPLSNPPNAYIFFLGVYGTITRVSDTPAPQTINGQAYSVYGYQLSDSAQVFSATVFLETTPTTEISQPELSANAEAPKLSFFEKLFGATS